MTDSPDLSDAPGLRGIINRYRIPVTIGVIVAVALSIALSMHHGDAPEQGGYYSIDDGKTFFQSPRKVPPFDYHGSEAVEAIVFSCDGGTNRSVAYLQKFTPGGKQRVEENDRAKRGGAPGGLLLKKPGALEWVAADDPANSRKIAVIKAITCPNGSNPTIYLPE